MVCFRCNMTEIFIFSLKYHPRKVAKNPLFSLQYDMKISSLHPAIVYENFIFTHKYAFAECCFLTFSFEGKLRKYDSSVKRKHMKTNENMIFSVLFTNFCKTKILFFMQGISSNKSYNTEAASKNFSSI